jgi:Kdo2-lipid IVA lauroyltransferase/acyltransferase
MSKRPQKTLQRIKNDAIFFAARGMFAFARAVPLKAGVRIGETLGAGAWHVLGHDRRLALVHLKTAFPEWTDAERRRVGRDSFANLGRNLFEMFHFDEILASTDGPEPYARLIGKEHLDKARERGRGGLLVTGHLGNWELMAATVVHCSYPGYEVARALYDPRIDKLLNDHRRKYGYIPLTRGGAELVQNIIDIFGRNEFLALLMDQDTKVRGVFANWFGYPAWSPSGPAFLCYQADFDAMMLLSHHEPGGGLVAEVTAPVPRPQTGDLKADIQAYTEILNRRLCDHIRRHPDQWVWMHRRWKTRPKGEAPERHPAPRPLKPYRLARLAEKLATGFARRLSWRGVDRVANAIGSLRSLFARRTARRMDGNLAVAFPDRTPGWRRDVRQKALTSTCRRVLTLLRTPQLDARFLAENVTVSGLDELEAAAKQGGVVLATARLGSPEVLLAKLSALGFPIDAADPPLDHPYLRRRFSWWRKALGVRMHAAWRSSFRVARALREGHLFVDVLDRPQPGKTVAAPFLGRERALPTSAARLARTTGASIIAAAAVPTGPGRYHLELSAPITATADLATDTAATAAALEAIIRKRAPHFHWDI